MRIRSVRVHQENDLLVYVLALYFRPMFIPICREIQAEKLRHLAPCGDYYYCTRATGEIVQPVEMCFKQIFPSNLTACGIHRNLFVPSLKINK